VSAWGLGQVKCLKQISSRENEGGNGDSEIVGKFDEIG